MLSGHGVHVHQTTAQLDSFNCSITKVMYIVRNAIDVGSHVIRVMDDIITYVDETSDSK